MSKTAIHFVCQAALHRLTSVSSRTGLAMSPLTIHEGKWSYCAAGELSGHEWRAIAPTPFELLKRRVRELEKV